MRPSPDRRWWAALAALAAAAVLGCSDSSAPAPGAIPTFVYVADANGFAELVRYQGNVITGLTGPGSNNTEPNSAADRIVFTSDRDGYPQLYIADLAITTPHRVMNSGAFDLTPSLSPSADSIVFVSTRSGAPRLWVIAAPALDAVGYGTPLALATGSATLTPESGPQWNPTGGSIAFTSTRTGVSQVFVVASGGGTAQQVTTESGGAFQPAWSADGHTLYYIAATPAYVLKQVSASGGSATPAVTDPLGVVGPASCNASVCVYSTDPTNAGGSMSMVQQSGGVIQEIFPRTLAHERQPAIITP